MLKFHTISCIAIFLICTANAQTGKPKKDVLAEPTTSGKVVGRVYGFETGKPLAGATVSVYQDGKFADKGQTTAVTDSNGQFNTKVILGRVSSNIDVGRLLTTSLIGLLAGAATNTTKRIDVTRFAVKVSAKGYKTFESVVRSRISDPAAFQATLEPIILVAEDKPTESATVPEWGIVGITEFTVTPEIAAPGTKVLFSVTVELPRDSEDAAVEVVLTSRFWKGAKKMRRDSPKTNRKIIFVADHTVGKKDKPRADAVTAFISRATFDIAVDKGSVSRLLQVANSTETETASKSRLEVLGFLASNAVTEAISRLKELSASANATIFDCEYLAVLSESRGSLEDAAAAQIQRMTLLPDAEKPIALSGYTRVLLGAKQYEPLVAQLESLRKSIPIKDQPKKISASAFGALGISYVRLGRIEDAKKLNLEITKMNMPNLGIDPIAIEFRSTLRLIDIEIGISKNPTDAKLFADYGRALLDQDRYEEAIPKLQESIRLDPKAGAVQRDYAYAVLRTQGNKTQIAPPLDEAIIAAKANAELDGKNKSRDFFAWHAYSLLLYQKYAQTEVANRKEVQDQLLNALREAVKVGRTGATRDPGISYYFGGWVPLTGSEVRVSGFAYSEAYADFLILESVKQLSINPDDYWANYNLATALLDLNLAGEATPVISKVSGARPDSADSSYLEASCLFRKDDFENAIAKLTTTLAKNPMHPTANLILAESLTKIGDSAGAAAALVAHAKWYPRSLLR